MIRRQGSLVKRLMNSFCNLRVPQHVINTNCTMKRSLTNFERFKELKEDLTQKLTNTEVKAKDTWVFL